MGRLTRQELRWLLAQEARGAADSLRQDVTLLTQPPPPAAEERAPRLDEKLESTLNALDDAIGLLSELESVPGRSRKGRIDLAALLYEVSPSAKISIEPGAGTEVFGEEADLRRLLHVLLSQSSSPVGARAPGAVVNVRRDGEWVRVSVDLGPDVSASVELERRWLSRMATRLGGTLELEGGTVSVLLPADASGHLGEFADLRKELEQAQQLGETYARELAAVFANADLSTAPAGSDKADVATRRFRLMLGMSTGMRSVFKPFVERLQEDADLSRTSLGESAALSRQLSRRVTTASEILGELNRLSECPPEEESIRTNIAAATRKTVQLAQRRSSRHGVTLAVTAPEALFVSTKPIAFAVLVRALLDHAIAATPKDGTVRVRVESGEKGVVLGIEDGGPAVPQASEGALLEGRIDPASLGRPSGISLLSAQTTAAYLGSPLRLGPSQGSGTEVVALFSPG